MKNIWVLFLLSLTAWPFSTEAWSQETSLTVDGPEGVPAKSFNPREVADPATPNTTENIRGSFPGPNPSSQLKGITFPAGRTVNQIQVNDGFMYGRLGQDSDGTYLSSDSNGSSLRFLTDNGGLNEWMRITTNGLVSITKNSVSNGEVGVAEDDLDTVQSYTGQAGAQMHFRLSRANCLNPLNPDDPANNKGCDSSNINAKDFLIVPYRYGISLEYPSVIETWSWDFSVHMNHKDCDPTITDWRANNSCNGAARFWVGDNWDTGGLFVTAYSDGVQADPGNSFVAIASDTYQHNSHGSLLFQIRNSQDSFKFQYGPFGSETTLARIDANGKGVFNGGTQVGGADFAESVAVAGDAKDYQEGDLLVIDSSSKQRLALSHEPYSTLVAGVYSSKPGVLATYHKMDSSELDQEVPLAVIGIVRCKVSTENGPIQIGDLLVASGTLGHAMKGTDRARLVGAVVGKALEPLHEGKGMIRILATLQ